MKQHPIPQNIMEVEFKLFTKFTLKEFAYVATGAVIGGLFIYLWTENRIPGIIAFPSLIFFGGAGLIMGMVPIQDQPADKILSSYIKAINRPTLRVWHGEELKLKMKKRKNAGKAGVAETQVVQLEQSNLVDSEEKDQLEKIGEMMEDTGLGKAEKREKVQQSGNLNSQKSLTITKENLEQYILPNTNVQLSGTVNMLLVNKHGQPVTNATVIVKDNAGKPRMALRSGSKGEVLSTQKLENGEYFVEINHEQNSFPKIRFLVEKPVYPLIKINSI